MKVKAKVKLKVSNVDHFREPLKNITSLKSLVSFVKNVKEVNKYKVMVGVDKALSERNLSKIPGGEEGRMYVQEGEFTPAEGSLDNIGLMVKHDQERPFLNGVVNNPAYPEVRDARRTLVSDLSVGHSVGSALHKYGETLSEFAKDRMITGKVRPELAITTGYRKTFIGAEYPFHPLVFSKQLYQSIDYAVIRK